MRLQADDPIRRVDLIWLGPHGFTLPFEARYLSWAVGLACILVFEALLWLSPLPMNGYTAFYTALFAIMFCLWLMQRVTHEVTIREAVVGLVHDVLGSTRPDPTSATILRTDHVRIHHRSE